MSILEILDIKEDIIKTIDNFEELKEKNKINTIENNSPIQREKKFINMTKKFENIIFNNSGEIIHYKHKKYRVNEE